MRCLLLFKSPLPLLSLNFSLFTLLLMSFTLPRSFDLHSWICLTKLVFTFDQFLSQLRAQHFPFHFFLLLHEWLISLRKSCFSVSISFSNLKKKFLKLFKIFQWFRLLLPFYCKISFLFTLHINVLDVWKTKK